MSGGAPGECSKQLRRPIPQQPSVHKGLNCKVLAGGDAGQEQLRKEPEGSQLASLAPESLQLVARLQGEEEEESALRPLLFCPGRPKLQGGGWRGCWARAAKRGAGREPTRLPGPIVPAAGGQAARGEGGGGVRPTLLLSTYPADPPHIG